MATRDVNLVIRARDEASKTADAISAAMDRLESAATGVAGSAKKTGGQLAQLAIDAATVERAFEKIDGAAKDAESAFARQEATLTETRAAYSATKAQMDAAATALANLRKQQGAAGVDQAALTAKIDAAEAAYRGLTRESTKLGSSIREQESSLNRSSAALQRIGSTAIGAETALKRAQAATKGTPAAGGGGLFGLKAYELQNLSFQVNDLFTQIASGTSVTQALAQQGGQVFQIFQSRLGELVRYLPALGGIAAALTPVLLGLDRLFDRQSALAEFNGALAASGDAATYSGSKLADAAHHLDEYGASADDAKTAVKEFVSEGVDPSRIAEFGEAALNASEVLGVKLADAAKDSAKAFTGGYAAIAEFDDRVNFLTESERGLIREMFESGNASEAREKAFRIFFDRMQDGADKARGEWAKSVRALQTAWSGFLDYLANSTVVETIGTSLTNAATAAGYLLNKLTGANALQTAAQDVNLFTNRIAELKDNIAKLGDPLGLKALRLTELSRQLKEAQTRLAALQAQQAKDAAPGAGGTAGGGAGTDPKGDSERARKKSAERLAELRREREGIGELTNAQTVRLAGERAYRAEIEKTGDVAAASYARQTAILREQTRIAKERERALKGTTALIAPVEGPVTSGFGKRSKPVAGGSQFHNANDIAVPVGTPVRAVADGRATVTRSEKGGLTVTLDLGNGYKAAFAHLSESLVKTGDVVAQGAIIARSGNSGSATTGPHLHYSLRQGDKPLDPRKTPRIKVDPGTAYQEAADAEEKLAAQTLETQTKLNRELAEDAARREASAHNQATLNGLTGTALLAAQRQQAIDAAIAAAREKVASASESIVKAGGEALALTDAQAKRIGDAAAAEFDAAHAREAATERRQAVERDVNVLLEQRAALQERIQFAQQQGQPGVVGELQTQLDTVNVKLTDATAKAIAFWQAIRSDPSQLALLGLTQEQVDNLILGMENARAGAQRLNTQFLETGRQINEGFAQGATGAISQFAQAVADGADVFDSLGDAFLKFAADFLLKIGEMIVQQAIFNAIGGAGGGGGAGVGGGIAGFLAGLFHDGGVVGSGGGLRAADPAWFVNAQRYHSGGIVGLAPNEFPAILQRNEEVLTADDPRHIANGGGAAAPKVDVKVVNSIDAGDFVSQGLGTKVGEKAILNLMRANPRAFKSALGT